MPVGRGLFGLRYENRPVRIDEALLTEISESSGGTLLPGARRAGAAGHLRADRPAGAVAGGGAQLRALHRALPVAARVGHRRAARRGVVAGLARSGAMNESVGGAWASRCCASTYRGPWPWRSCCCCRCWCAGRWCGSAGVAVRDCSATRPRVPSLVSARHPPAAAARWCASPVVALLGAVALTGPRWGMVQFAGNAPRHRRRDRARRVALHARARRTAIAPRTHEAGGAPAARAVARRPHRAHRLRRPELHPLAAHRRRRSARAVPRQPVAGCRGAGGVLDCAGDPPGHRAARRVHRHRPTGRWWS